MTRHRQAQGTVLITYLLFGANFAVSDRPGVNYVRIAEMRRAAFGLGLRVKIAVDVER